MGCRERGCDYDECLACFAGYAPPELANGAQVARGPTWKWGEQDGGDGALGVTSVDPDAGWVRVTWAGARSGNYRYRYDPSEGLLNVVPHPNGARVSGTVNDAGWPVRRGAGAGAATLYCGRRLGRAAIPGSDGQCGPNNGPQCASCARAQAALR
jgi:hypothetical protein